MNGIVADVLIFLAVGWTGILAGATVGGVGFLGLLSRFGIVELEWNPRSLASRAARAERAGRLGEALALYAAAGKRKRIRRAVERSLPRSDLRKDLLEIVGALETVDVWGKRALAAGVPIEVASAAADHARLAQAEVWAAADRIAAASALGRKTPGFIEERIRLRNLLAAINDTRDALAELALTVGISSDATGQLRQLADAAHGITEVRNAAA